MKYTRLGSKGLKVSRICLGRMTYGIPKRGTHLWTLPEEKSRPFIQRALELGINFFDTANAYSDGTSEENIGHTLRDFAKRDEIVLATKVFHSWKDKPNTGGLSRRAIFTAVDDSLPQPQIALTWMLHKPVITAPIVGAPKPGHLEDAVAALSVDLSPEEIAALEEPYVPHAIAGFN